MFNPNDPAVFWLNVTNLALGAVVLVCCVAVLVGVVREIAVRLRGRVTAALPSDDHLFVLPELGVTMADGGEKSDESNEKR